MKTTIYSTETYNDQVEAQFKCEPYDKILIQIEDNNLVDTRTGEEYTDGYRATLCTVSKFGNLFINYGFTCKGKSLASCKRAANRMLHKYFNLHLSDVVAEGSTLEEMHASLTDPTVHENFKVWTANLFMAENPETETPANHAAEDAAYSLINAYADAIGEYPAETDPEYMAAFAVAGEDIAGWHGVADIHDRATVAQMVEAIADRAREAAAFKAYKLNVPYLVWEDDPATETPENYAAEAAAFSFIEAYAGASLFSPSETDPEFIAAFHVAADDVAGMHIATDADRATVADMLEEIAEDTAWSAVYATLRKDPDVTPEEMREIMDNPRAYLMSAARAAIAEDLEEPAPIYQRYELLAYLGDPDAYDVEAIEAEATRYTADGARVWAAFGEDLAAIAERHELFAYYAI